MENDEKGLLLFLERLFNLNTGMPADFAQSGDISKEWQEDLYSNLSQVEAACQRLTHISRP